MLHCPSLPATGSSTAYPPPGSPRAYNIPDRYHPEEDGADPRVRQTVLQQHVESFDYVSGPERHHAGQLLLDYAM